MSTVNPQLQKSASENYFRVVSYLVVLCGIFALWAAGAFGLVTLVAYFLIAAVAWRLEETGKQISERIGTALTLIALPVFLALWKIGFFARGPYETVLPAVLAKLIIFLTLIKLFQKKSDRDWTFLYVMSFFEVLLAAGLSIGASYIVSFFLFTFCFTCAIIAFEIRRSRRIIADAMKIPDGGEGLSGRRESRRIPVAAIVLITLIVALAVPMFFLIPRVGGASTGKETGGVSTRSGFADSVQLGGIGRIQQNDEVVMRVRLEGGTPPAGLRWRGTAFDVFDGRSWSKSRPGIKEVRTRGDRELIQVDFASGRNSLLVQTVYLEPIDTPIIFAAPRAVGFQGSFPVIFKDDDDSLSLQRPGERLTYKAISDVALPTVEALRNDSGSYSPQDTKYLQLPDSFDPRIAALAAKVTSGASNRFDAAEAVETYLKSNYGYTLELKAGGDDPLADFLFNVREGHCEYFASAMATMLRSQGIATRLAAGFQRGDYNDTADVFVVRQRHAHAWVEVFFPDNHVWVPFDPTPSAASDVSAAYGGQIGRNLRKYMDALEMYWIQYFVAFDNQEQRSLLSNTGKMLSAFKADISRKLGSARNFAAEFWAKLSGREGIQGAAEAVGKAIISVLAIAALIYGFVFAGRRLLKSNVWNSVKRRFLARGRDARVEFYNRFLELLAAAGIEKKAYETPLEFAYGTNLSEAIEITEKYHIVRFGRRNLSESENRRITSLLNQIEERLKSGRL